jgi:hypothetical protein
VLIIAFGAIEAFLRLLKPLFGRPATHGERKLLAYDLHEILLILILPLIHRLRLMTDNSVPKK